MILQEKCGLALAHTLHDCYELLGSVNHRGKDAAGIAGIGEDRIDVVKWIGRVNNFDLTDLHKLLPREKYHTFIGHVRYATRGNKQGALDEAQPLTIDGEVYRQEDHVIIRGARLAIAHNGQIPPEYLASVDSNLLNTESDSEGLLRLYDASSEKVIMRTIPGSYTAIIADVNKRGVSVLRDRHGMMPGVIGFKDGTHVFTSEDCAFTRNNINTIEDLIPGATYTFEPNGSYSSEVVVPSNPSHCFLTWNYLASIISTLDRVNVRTLREILGEKLAEEFPLEADFVTFNPRSPEPAARTYARMRGIEFLPIFYKKTSERSFQGANQNLRSDSIRKNLHIIPEVMDRVRGKKVIVIDDSIIRGTVTRTAKSLLSSLDVSDVTCLSYTPPIGIMGSDGIARGCHYGVDMPPSDDFVARNKNTQEISRLLGVSVGYLSLDGMLKGFKEAGISSDKLCTFCVGGKEPFTSLTINGS